MLVDLLAVEYYRDAGIFAGFGFADGQGADVELPAPEHAGHAVQHPELVVYEYRYGISLHVSYPPLQ